MGALNALVLGVVGILIARLKEWGKEHKEDRLRTEAELKALKDGVRSMTSDRLIQSCNFTNSVGVVTIQQLNNITSLYDSYHTLGGNGTITALVRQIQSLKIVDEEEFKRHKKEMGVI